MRFLKLIIFLFSLSVVAQNKFVTPFEQGNGNQSTTYEECISFYEALDEAYSTIKMVQKGTTDSGKPLYLVIYSNDGQFEYDDKNLNKKAIILINNGIHPGEPDGIDASMLLMRDLAMGKIKTAKNTFIAIIPVYNVGGMLNRNSHSRANQNGPEEYGFRGNGRNYDLNRDFIKSDTKIQEVFSNCLQN